MKSTLRQRLLTSTLLIGVAGFASPAFAQPQDETEDSPEIQAEADPTSGFQDPNAPREESGAIIITGSRIARRDLTSTSPLAVVQDEEFTLSGAVNVEQVINTLPQVIPGATAFSNNPGGGVATLNLRGLGSERNLVLVNGRRWVFFDTNQVVDLNSIPQFMIDSVDVVTGGASAVYGSDALAGVVNFRLRTDLDGFVGGGQYSITEEGDGRRYNAYVAMGSQFNDGRGHVAAFAEYYNRGQVMQGDRAFSRCALGDGATQLECIGSSIVPQGRIAAPATFQLTDAAGDPIGAPIPIAQGTPFGASAFGAIFAQPGVARAYISSGANNDSHNYAPENYLMVPQERWMVGGYAEYEVAQDLHAYTELVFVNNRVANELAATPVAGNVDVQLAAACANVNAQACAQLQQIAAGQQAANAAAAAAGRPLPFNNFTIGTTNQGVPLPATHVRLSVNRRVTELGSRNALDERNSWRVLAGLRGNLTDTLTYDVYYMFARTRNSQIQQGNVSRSAFNTNVANGTCNVFGAGTLSPTCLDNIGILAQNSDISQLQVAQASISGPLFQFGWANDPVAFAAGLEWRSMSGQFIPDTALSSGDVVGFNAGNPTEGAYDVKEAFAEIRIPIVQDSFLHRLEISGAARYSDYSLENVGGVWTYALGGEFAPIRDITFRGQYQRAIRAPNVQELFGGQQIGFPPATDPCAVPANAGNATIQALCIATGVPAALVFTPGIQPNAQIQGTFGGNPNLEEEVADTWTVGAVISPRFIPRLNITIDYYDIEIANAIAPAAGGVNNILNLCYNVIQDANHPICQAVNRNPLTGAIEAPFLVEANNANLGAFLTNGIDFQIDYSQPLGFSAMGAGESRLSFFFLGNWTDESDFIPVVGLDEVSVCGGRFGNICGEPTPTWKWSSRLSWIDGPLTTSFRWRHVGSVRDDDDDTDFIVERIGSYDLFDLAFAFNVNDNLTLNLGVNNLFDKQPPIIGDNQEQSNTFPSTYDVIGRDFFISANLRF